MTSLALLQQEVIACTRCHRLRKHCAEIARVKRRAYLDHEYWGKPLPSFGDPKARLLIVGLAPGNHGANRTGRMFTGDASGALLYRVLYETGFSDRAESTWRGDGLTLHDCYITAAGRCAPPDNKPLPEELRNCRPYLEREFALLKKVCVVVALGKIAHDACLAVLEVSRAAHPFRHGCVYDFGGGHPLLISSYHPSQQNTSTGRLTEAMLLDVFRKARSLTTAVNPGRSPAATGLTTA